YLLTRSTVTALLLDTAGRWVTAGRGRTFRGGKVDVLSVRRPAAPAIPCGRAVTTRHDRNAGGRGTEIGERRRGRRASAAHGTARLSPRPPGGTGGADRSPGAGAAGWRAGWRG